MSDTETGASRSLRKTNILLLSCLFVFFAVLFVMSQALGGTAGQVPQLISGIGLVLTVIELIGQVGALRNGSVEEDAVGPAGLRWYFSLVALLAYIAILMLFGFIVSTAIYLLVFPATMGYRKWRVNLVFALVSTAILYYGFVQLFMVRLPEGIITTSLLKGF